MESIGTARIVAVGDIHGEYNKLIDLMWNLSDYGVDFDTDQFVFLGDYVDGGPDTKLVIEFLQWFGRLYPNSVFLKGNHEDMLANAYFERQRYDNPFLMWYTQGGMETLQSYMKPHAVAAENEELGFHFVTTTEGTDVDTVRRYIPPSHVEWMDHLPLMYETIRFVFAHAGIRPGVPLEHQGEFDLLWIRNEFIKNKSDHGKRVVFGHTARDKPVVMDNKIGIDTMHHGRGVITAAILDDESGAVVDFVTSGPTAWSWNKG